MNINASIIDQRITKIIEQHSDWLPDGDINKQKSSAFVLLCMATVLDIELEETVELLTDGASHEILEVQQIKARSPRCFRMQRELFK
jgi:hypothetical protein